MRCASPRGDIEFSVALPLTQLSTIAPLLFSIFICPSSPLPLLSFFSSHRSSAVFLLFQPAPPCYFLF